MCKRIAPTCIGIPVSYFDGLFSRRISATFLLGCHCCSFTFRPHAVISCNIRLVSNKHRISREYCLASLQEGNGLNMFERSWTDRSQTQKCCCCKTSVCWITNCNIRRSTSLWSHRHSWSQLFTSCPSRMLLLSIKGLSRASSFERRRSCHKESTPTPTHKSFDEPCRLMSHKQHHIAGLRLCPVTKFIYFVALLHGNAGQGAAKQGNNMH